MRAVWGRGALLLGVRAVAGSLSHYKHIMNGCLTSTNLIKGQIHSEQANR